MFYVNRLLQTIHMKYQDLLSGRLLKFLLGVLGVTMTICMLHRENRVKSLNKTETPIFLSVVCSLFPKAIVLTFISDTCS